MKAEFTWQETPAPQQDPNIHFEVWDADISQHVTGTAVRPDGTFTAAPTAANPAILDYTAQGPGSYGIAIFAVDSHGQKSDPVFVTFTLAFAKPAAVSNALFIGQV